MIPLSTVLATSILMSCSAVSFGGQPVKGEGGQNRNVPQLRSSGVGGGAGGSAQSSRESGSGSMDHGFHGDRWQDRVPREPMWFINAGPGVRNSAVHPEDNAIGIASWWRGDRAVDELLIRIHRGYDSGARWFFINRPMGTPGNTYVPGASWLTIEKDKRERIPELLTQALLDEFDEPVHVVWFVGSDMSDPRDFPGWTPGRDDEFYQLGRDKNWGELIGSRVTLGGWISTGASGVAIDNSSPMHKRSHYKKLFEQLNQFPFHLAVYGEAYPLMFQENGHMQRDDDGLVMVDQESIRSMPWVATEQYIEHHWPLPIESPTSSFDQSDTRMFIWFDRTVLSYGDAEDRKEMINDYMDRGLIPITYDPVMFSEAMNRYRAEQPALQNTIRAGESGQSSTRGSSSQRTTGNASPAQQLPQRYRRKGRGIR